MESVLNILNILHVYRNDKITLAGSLETTQESQLKKRIPTTKLR